MNDEAVYVQLPPIHLNQSRRKNYDDCNRLYGWWDVEALSPAKPRKQLAFGTAVHRAQVEVYNKGFSPEVVQEATKLAVQMFVKQMTPKPAGPEIALPGVQVKDAEIEEGSRLLSKLLPAYYRHYGDLGQLWKPLGMELDFCVEVGEGTKVYLVGTIDNLAVYFESLWIVDTKTMHKLDMREFRKYFTDLQLTAYIYAGTKQLSINAMREGKKPVAIRGAIIDGMVKTDVPQFHREMYTRTIEELREFEMEWCFKAWEIASKHAILRGDKAVYNLLRDKMYDLGASTNWKTVFAKNTNHCFRYGECPFHTLCMKDNPTRRLAFIKRPSDYVDSARTTKRTE